jgi:hypothetical protein
MEIQLDAISSHMATVQSSCQVLFCLLYIVILFMLFVHVSVVVIVIVIALLF